MKTNTKVLVAVLLILTLVFEVFALQILSTNVNMRMILIVVFFLHLFAMLIMAYAQHLFIPSLYHQQRKQIYWLLFTFDAIVPFLGMLAGWGLVLWGFRKSQELKIDKEIDDIDTDSLNNGFPVITRIFGEGSLPALITNHHIPSQKKIKALSILTQMKSKASLSLIKQSLSDPNDEVRLVGFSMLDKLEKRINQKIHELKNISRVQPDPKKRAKSHLELAFTYWELLYQGLVDPQLEHFLINNILQEISEAKKEIIDDPKLFKLEGRVLLLQKAYSKAKSAFVQALELGLPQGEIASFMAQIAYEERNFSRIAYWMAKVPEKSINYQLHTLRAVWVRK